ncbi:hypothetical protein I3843_02G146200 [Carya illinoinensis]|uniref:glyoxylate reductase (NADP(+)) n=1 Tax=Carya illinoinensis TaxID=32201 RepID=A0A8T1REU3_CARIL|nr:glyoxylate/hydroxypyruvate reductase HPR3-like [Carya illinoinensis]XP_042968396.1 glyoxylate/hydroxypyruvate reductase HPR3-like [Carya illinoinensis]XP_042968397.1 glyoxylate/hydroxypyruvate reductase HPR3-like [Carya illinoinensis]KAG2723377.1 hypothetical protein I3760_02G168200 [Carya illinoinensis]KAG2723378.1 hypothetical protein I3760_02G168200 [Carya illinoinensis]KAG2723379.1 hypothetical protein I3760_02G168200 [Carya illinoinensis]KAG6665548.1 hypothetical protein CIPAW_02G1689
MEAHDNCQVNYEELPQILVLEPPPIMIFYGDQFLKNFRLLKAWESQLPLDQFLTIHAQSVQALLSPGRYLLTTDILQLLPSLQLVVTTSAGLDHINLPECRRRGISIANANDTYSADVADMAVGLLIDVFRKMSSADSFVRKGLWPTKGDFPLGSKLGGKRVGIVGLGSIGQEVAKRLHAFGCRISYSSRNKKPYVSYPFYPSVVQLAKDCDVLIVCCGLTQQTHHMINKDVMLALGKEGVVINVGRGPIIKEEELVQCLVQGELGGAGLDVFENEPNVPGELFTLDKVVLSPHRAVHTAETLMAMCELVKANFEAFFSNKPLPSPIVLNN